MESIHGGERPNIRHLPRMDSLHTRYLAAPVSSPVGSRYRHASSAPLASPSYLPDLRDSSQHSHSVVVAVVMAAQMLHIRRSRLVVFPSACMDPGSGRIRESSGRSEHMRIPAGGRKEAGDELPQNGVPPNDQRWTRILVLDPLACARADCGRKGLDAVAAEGRSALEDLMDA
jgi:hypothetical protein